MTYILHHLNNHGVPLVSERVRMPEDWRVVRQEILERWIDFIGDLPDRVSPDITINSETFENGYVRQHITYSTVETDFVTAHLLMPDKVIETKFPAVLALHGTDELGKESISSETASRKAKFALELVKRGYVVLAPDAITAGERIIQGEKSFHNKPFYQKYKSWTSITAKNVIDHMQALDVLVQHDMVDEQRIGVIGHSFGGYNAYYLAGFDNRIKAVVSSCGFSTFTGDFQPDRWGNRDWYTHFPKLTSMIKEGEIPFEFNEIMALAAPKPLFNWSGQNDAIFPHWKSIGTGLQDISLLYEVLGYKNHFVSLLGAYDHGFPPCIRETAYRFLDTWLNHTPVNNQPIMD